MKKPKIMFVCTGNICRSPLAHALFEKRAGERGLAVEVESSGTHGYHRGENADSRMRGVAASHGAGFNHRARSFNSTDIENYDYIFVMDRGHFREIEFLAERSGLENVLAGKLRMFREFDPKSQGSRRGRGAGGAQNANRSEHARGDFSEDVPDPYYGGADGFELVYSIVERTVDVLVDRLLSGEL